MPRLMFASMRGGAGKTSMIVGLGTALKKRIGYVKPFGDRLLYRKKRLWDYDAALIASIFDLDDNPEEMSIGFDHSKLRFMYDEAATKEKLNEVFAHVEADKDVVFIEGGMDMSHGLSVHLDPLFIARHTGATLIVVLSGDEGVVLDDIAFIERHLDLEGVSLGGVIINKVHDVEDFKSSHLGGLEDSQVPILGVVPYRKQLTSLSIAYLADALFAKVIAGEDGVQRVVRNLFVGAMSADAVMRNPLFGKEEKLVITSGDRSDMILAALQGDAAGIVVTNNIFPPANIISMADERKTPILLVPADTFQAAKQIDDLERLLTKDEAGKIALLGEVVGESVNLEGVLGR
ncbi:DRTGG domain-containing protein [Candidatus Eisenbacteria bacterium]|uniref:DRTGG domain-containing protein n=1 Tax=Eiseniibacteriota bacterium TaxID=2212470 RepID=A0ABV6YI59_UNCEI